MSACPFCDASHPNGVPADAIAAGHPYAIDRGFGIEYVRTNPATGTRERLNGDTFVPDDRARSAER